MFNITELASHINSVNGLGFNAHFDVAITIPKGLQGDSTIGDGRNITFMAFSASLPGVDMETIQFQKFNMGFSQSRPISANFNSMDILFYYDNKSQIINLFNKWALLTNNFNYEGTKKGDPNHPIYTTSYPDQYESPAITITHYTNNTKKTPTAVFTLNKAWPSRISNIETNWSDSNRLLTLGVNFLYNGWSRKDL